LVDKYAHGTAAQKSERQDLYLQSDKADLKQYYESLYCVHHTEEKITLFCNMHEEVACGHCQFREHDKCKMEKLKYVLNRIVIPKDGDNERNSERSHAGQPFPRPTERTAGNMV